MTDPVPSSVNVSFRQSVYVTSHPQMEADVVIVGGGPAGLACALRLSQLIDKHNSVNSERKLSKENIFVLEKARTLGGHALSGALLDPRSMQELLPGFEREAPLDTTVSRQSVYFLTRKSKFKLPVIPGALRDQGHHVISLNRFVKWLGRKVEEAGITVFTGFAGSLLLFEDDRVVGVRTEDKGVDRHGQLKSNFEPGYDLKAKVVVLAEGARGSLAKQLFEHCGLQKGPNPQTFGVGVKELWEIPPGRVAPGEVIYTLGWPLTIQEYGGSWIYGMAGNIISLGFVTGLHYADPRTDPHHILQSFKQHPFVAKLLDGGKILGYGAKALPYGGWWSIPPLAGHGWMILGDSAGFLNAQRLKGIHLAIKSGMLAAETIFDAMRTADFSPERLGRYRERIDKSWMKEELWPVRNFHQSFETGFVKGLFHAALQQFTGGRGLHARYTSHPGHTRMRHLSEFAPDGGTRKYITGWAEGDGKLTFDKLTDLYYSGTKHEEDQPSHLVLLDVNICNTRCVQEFGNPCQYYCPAAVYEMIEALDMPFGKQIHLNPSNCVHCKTCDIMDPYQNISWVPPEGGGGPSYDGM